MTRLPTPDDLADAPEVAALAILGTALDVAVAALVAAYPELNSPEDYLREPASFGPSALVWTLVTLSRCLARQIDLYRELLAADPDPDDGPAF